MIKHSFLFFLSNVKSIGENYQPDIPFRATLMKKPFTQDFLSLDTKFGGLYVTM